MVKIVSDILSAHKAEIMTFPSHSTGSFRMLDLSLLCVFKTYKKHPSKDTLVFVMQDHAARMLKACKATRVSTMVTACLARAGFVFHKDAEGGYILGFDEHRVRNSPAFREVWDVNFALESPSARRRAIQLGFMNQEALNT
jgi:hypothetical protein